MSGRETHQAHHDSLGTPIGLVSSGWNRDQAKASATASRSAGRARISFRRALERHGTSKPHNLNSCRGREMAGGEEWHGREGCMSIYVRTFCTYLGCQGGWRRRWNRGRERGTTNERPSASFRVVPNMFIVHRIRTCAGRYGSCVGENADTERRP